MLLPGILWAAAVIASVLAVQFYFGARTARMEIPGAHFVEEVEKGNIAKLAVAQGGTAHQVWGELRVAGTATVAGRDVEFKEFKSQYPSDRAPLAEFVSAKNPNVEIASGPPSTEGSTVVTYVPFVVLILASMWLVGRQARLKPQTES